MELRWCRPFDLNKRPKDEETQLHWHENEMGGWGTQSFNINLDSTLVQTKMATCPQSETGRENM